MVPAGFSLSARIVGTALALTFPKRLNRQDAEDHGGGGDIAKHQEDGELVPLLKLQPQRIPRRDALDRGPHGAAQTE